LIVKQKFIFFISFFLCTLIAFTGGCTKTEDPNKPGVSVTAPTGPPSPEAGDKAVSSSAQEPSAVPTPVPDKSKAPSAGVSAVPPEEPDVPVKPAVKDIVLVAGFQSSQMQKGAPVGWSLDRRKGTPDIKLEKGSEIYCLHMRSNNESSFGVKKGVKINIREYPYLNWRWKVTRLPDGGDVRQSNTDDQAIQLYVAFIPAGFPAALNTPVLGYIWDNKAPKGWTGRSPQIGGGKLRYVVVRNNADQLGRWYTEKRNIYEDYRRLLKDVKSGEPPGMTHGVQFHINSQNTESEAESYICEVYFSKS